MTYADWLRLTRADGRPWHLHREDLGSFAPVGDASKRDWSGRPMADDRARTEVYRRCDPEPYLVRETVEEIAMLLDLKT